MKLVQVGITARDAENLAAFHVAAFGCKPRRPAVTLSGARFAAGCGLPSARITGI